MKHWLVIYDIRDPKRLSRVAKVMVSFGVRVQKSVFEVEANDKVVEYLREKIKEIIEPEDFVVYFDICVKDWQKKMKYGPEKFEENDEKSYYIV